MEDLTTTFPKGVNSIKIGATAGNWQAFVEPNYGGSHVTLDQGQLHNSLQDMGLNGPIKSIRKAR